MSVIKFAVVLCFAAALVLLSNYPQLVTVHGAAPKVLPQIATGSGRAYTSHTAYVDSPRGTGCTSAGCHTSEMGMNYLSRRRSFGVRSTPAFSIATAMPCLPFGYFQLQFLKPLRFGFQPFYF